MSDSKPEQIVYASPGTVSSGTLRTQDLLPRFAKELEAMLDRQPKCNETLNRSKLKLLGETANPSLDYDSENAESLCFDIMDALEDFAPPGYYFGSHRCEGADFGFWEAS